MSKVFLHVGAPKTGTSGIQDLLYVNRPTLAEHGVLYPSDITDAQFFAALDLLQRTWGGLEDQAHGSWKALVERVRKHEGTAVISHEVFAGATAEQAATAIADLGAEGHEVHLVYSARDLTRQIPAEWQEQVKHRQRFSFERFLTRLRQEETETYAATWFWKVHAWPDVIARWGATLPPERVHVVTVPPPGAPRELLAERFLGLWGIEPEWVPESGARANVSLGAVETAVLREINRRNRPDDYDGVYYREFVRERLVHRGLAGREDAVRVALPPALAPWVSEITDGWLARLEEAGYDVVGDLDDLKPIPPASDWVDPDGVSNAVKLKVAYDVIDNLLVQLREERDDRRDEESGWRQRLSDAVTESRDPEKREVAKRRVRSWRSRPR